MRAALASRGLRSSPPHTEPPGYPGYTQVRPRNQSLTWARAASTVPPQAYTSEGFFRLKVERILRRQWLRALSRICLHRWAALAPGDWVIGSTLEYDCQINWKIGLETLMECNHHIAAHPETFERVYPARLTRVEDRRRAWRTLWPLAEYVRQRIKD